jgi:hypothetical protein
MNRNFFSDISQDLTDRRAHLASRVRRRVWRARTATAVQAWQLQVAGLEQLHSLTARAPERLGLDTLVTDQLDRLITPALVDYDELTAKDIVSAVKDMTDARELTRIARYEQAHKERKTVLAAVEKRQADLVPEVVPLPERVEPVVDEVVAAG